MPQRRNLENKIGASPARRNPRSYRNAQPGYSVDEIDPKRVFHPNEEFRDEDDQRVQEKLVQSGVDEPFDDQDHPNERDEDREFALDRQSYQSAVRREHIDDEQGILEGLDDLDLDSDLDSDIEQSLDSSEEEDEERDLLGADEDLDLRVNQRPLKADREP